MDIFISPGGWVDVFHSFMGVKLAEHAARAVHGLPMTGMLADMLRIINQENVHRQDLYAQVLPSYPQITIPQTIPAHAHACILQNSAIA